MGAAKTLLIANPAPASGRLSRDWERIYQQIKEYHKGSFEVEMTQRPGQATELCREAILAGYKMIVAIGGDGTINEVLNGFLPPSRDSQGDVLLGGLPFGTGNDLRRSLGIPRDFSRAIQALNGSGGRFIDVGKVTLPNADGATEERYFLNIADFGSGGAIVERVNRTTKAFGPQVSYLWGIISTMASYENTKVAFSIDGQGEREAVINSFIIANGRYFGGGLKAAPCAELDDGLFDIVTLGDIGIVEGLINLPKLRRGTHLSHKKVRFCRGRRVAARANRKVLIEADGELIGSLPAIFEIIPQSLRITV